MYIFYDFETSTRDLLGQILTYSFVVTNANFEIQKELSGAIQLSPIQLPEVEALLTNKIRILAHKGDPEYVAAEKIFEFLNDYTQHAQAVFLVGYNSNKFDLQFLRNLLIRFGINPYFSGRLKNLDLLHIVQTLAFEHEDDFPWALKTENGKRNYSFRLEDMAKQFNLLSGPQTHDAREDVLLCIALAKTLEVHFKFKISAFKATGFPDKNEMPAKHEVFKQRVRVYSENGIEMPLRYGFKNWLMMISDPKDCIVLDLDRYQETPEEPLAALRYINYNKQLFRIETLNEKEQKAIQAILDRAKADPTLQLMTKNKDTYFRLTKKNWDIEYQIHELGFERIDQLGSYIRKLIQTPQSYADSLKALMTSDSDPPIKNRYMIQLFNRALLATFSNAPLALAKRYITPRYVEGKLQRNPEDFTPLVDYKKRLDEKLSDSDLSPEDQEIVKQASLHFSGFCEKYQLIL